MAHYFQCIFNSPTELHPLIYYAQPREQVGLYFFEIDQYIMTETSQKKLIVLFLSVLSKKNCAFTFSFVVQFDCKINKRQHKWYNHFEVISTPSEISDTSTDRSRTPSCRYQQRLQNALMHSHKTSVEYCSNVKRLGQKFMALFCHEKKNFTQRQFTTVELCKGTIF